MSILIIALLHAVPIVLVGAKTENRFALNVITGIMCLFAVLLGSPIYSIIDLLVIGVTYKFIVPMIHKAHMRTIDVFNKKLKGNWSKKDNNT